MQIIEVYQPYDEDMNGTRSYLSEYYEDKEEARKRCNGIGRGLQHEPRELLGLQVKPGEVYIFVQSEPFKIFKTTDEMKKARALDKLTPEERKLLGHG